MSNFRSDVIGSLLRPQYLKEARARRAKETSALSNSNRSKTVPLTRRLICKRAVVSTCLTDGEMRRYAFYGHLIDAVEGYDKYGGWAIPFRDEHGNELILKRPVVVSKLKRVRPMCEEEFTVRARPHNASGQSDPYQREQAAAYYAPTNPRRIRDD